MLNDSDYEETISIIVYASGSVSNSLLTISSALNQIESTAKVTVIDALHSLALSQSISQLNDNRVELITAENCKEVERINQIIRWGRSKFYLFLKSSDVLLEDSIKLFKSFLSDSSNVDILYGDKIILDSNLKYKKAQHYSSWLNELPNLLDYEGLPESGVLLSNKILAKESYFNVAFKNEFIYEFLIRVASTTCFHHINNFSIAQLEKTQTEIHSRYSEISTIHKNTIEKQNLEILFPTLEWGCKDYLTNEGEAYRLLSDMFLKLNDYEASNYYQDLGEDINNSIDLNKSISKQQPAKINSSSSKTPKVIIVQGGFPKISATFILDQITGLLDRGVEIENWSTYDPKESFIHPIIGKYGLLKKTKYLKFPQEFLAADPIKWYEEFKQLNTIKNFDNIDAFHIHFGPNFNKLAPLFKILSSKVVVSFHGYDASRNLKNQTSEYYRYLYDRADIITTPSGVMKERLIANGCSPEKLLIHRYGVELSQFNAEIEKHNHSSVRLLTVARLVEKKGIEFTLQALAHLKQLNFSYRIVGDGELRSKLEKLTTTLRIQDKVSFVGSMDKAGVVYEMSQADIYILNSITASDGDEEGLPVSLIEAQAMGLPVVSSFHAGIPELVVDRGTGILCEEKNVSQITEALYELITNRELRLQMASSARKKVVQEFDIHKLNDRLLNSIIGNVHSDEHNRKVLNQELCRVGWQYKKLFYEESFLSVEKINEVTKPSVSIIVISWRLCPEMIVNFQKLSEQRAAGFELIFVDNGGAPGEFDQARPYIDTYVKLKKDTGAYVARNIASLFAKAEILLFLDDDAIPEKNFVQAHLEQFDNFDVIAVRGVVIPVTDSELNKLAKHYYLGPKPFPVFCDVECNVSYKAESFFSVGGWDDEIRFGCGGAELALRLIELYPDYCKQIYSPEPVIYHDYAHNEEHLKIKRIRQDQSRLRLRKKYPHWDQFLKSWSIFSGRSELIKLKDSTNAMSLIERF